MNCFCLWQRFALAQAICTYSFFLRARAVMSTPGASSSDGWASPSPLFADSQPPVSPEGWGPAAAEPTGSVELGAVASVVGGVESSPDGWQESEDEAPPAAVAAAPAASWPSIQQSLLASPPKRRPKGRPKKIAAAKAPVAVCPGGPDALSGREVVAPLAHGVLVPSSVLHRGDARGDWVLPPGTIARLRRPQKVGEPHPLAGVLRTLSQSLVPGGPVDEDARGVALSLLGSAEQPVAGSTLRADLAGLGRFSFATRQQSSVSAALVASRSARWELEEGMALQRPGVECLLYLDYNRYDETPMRVKSAGGSSIAAGGPVQRAGESGDGKRFAGAVALAPLSGAMVPWTPDVGESAVTISDHGKLLQAESQYGLLLRINGKYCTVRGSTLTHLMNLEACSARCLLAAQRQVSSISPACGRFKLRLRGSTTDRASANLLCEKAMAGSLQGAAFVGLHLGCDVHAVSRIHSKVFSLVEPTVSGVLRHALSLQGGAHMNLFRKAIRQEIRSRGGVIVRRGAASLEARRHRELMLRLFAARGRCILSRRVLLMLLPNGDWRQQQVEIFVDHSSQLTQQEAERQLANGLVTALAGSQFEVYPRHRWTGADVAFDRCGLLEAVHGLGRGAYNRFLQLLGEGRAGGRQGPAIAMPYLAVEDGVAEDEAPAAAEAGMVRLVFHICIVRLMSMRREAILRNEACAIRCDRWWFVCM